MYHQVNKLYSHCNINRIMLRSVRNMFRKLRRALSSRKLFHVFALALIMTLIFNSLMKYNKSSKHAIDQLPDHFSVFYNRKLMIGQSFSEKTVEAAQRIMNIPPKVSDELQTDDLDVLKQEPVFVSAFSDNHFYEGLRMLKSVQKVYNKKKKVNVYDIGLRYIP